jgi:hypothetical protein
MDFMSSKRCKRYWGNESKRYLKITAKMGKVPKLQVYNPCNNFSNVYFVTMVIFEIRFLCVFIPIYFLL